MMHWQSGCSWQPHVSSTRCPTCRPRGAGDLEAARSALATERQEWTTRLETAETDRARAQAAKDLAEHACATLDAQLQDNHALRADLAQQRDRLQAQCDQLAAELQGCAPNWPKASLSHFGRPVQLKGDTVKRNDMVNW